MITPQTLSQSELFAGLSEDQLTSIAVLAEEMSCAKGETLFEEGEPATRLFLLLEGKVAIQVQLSSRPERITITVLNQPGQLVGWSGFVPPNHYTATATCQADSRLLTLDGDAFMRVLEQDPAMGFVIVRHITTVISDRLRNIQRVVIKTM